MRAFLVAACLGWCSVERAIAAPPLPEAPVRVSIPDASAFDAALRGRFREVLSGGAGEGDPVVAAWRASRIGSKLEDQWSRLSKDLPWTWTEIRRLKPQSLSLALLDAGALEAVLVVETPLATLPLVPPRGAVKTHAGVEYHVVTPGAGDASPDAQRRAGLAWCRHEGRLYLATSERSLLLALDAASRSEGASETRAGDLVVVDLDVDALAKDRYFRREFLFGDNTVTGHVRARLRLEEGALVEVRDGQGGEVGPAYLFDAPAAAASGFVRAELDFFEVLRAALLEPLPSPSPKPLLAVGPLPPAKAEAPEDRYAVSIERPRTARGGEALEEGELRSWRELLSQERVDGFGYVVAKDGARNLVFRWPASKDAEWEALVRATAARRAARVDAALVGDTHELRVGPGLATIAWRRTGDFLWVGPSAAALSAVREPRASGDLLRWTRLDLDALAAEGVRWARAEGPESPERVRPFSDRILGLLGWVPNVRAISVERRKTETGWTERVLFEPRQR